MHDIFEGDCATFLDEAHVGKVQLTFLDPPYRQGKSYKYFDDKQPEDIYWSWLKGILSRVQRVTVQGGAVYFMQREKNAEHVLDALRKTGWTLQNLIIWRKKTSAVPSELRFSKQYQIIAFATKGEKPRVFNRLRVDLPLLPEYKHARARGVYVTDIWDDLRELTSGYLAGEEAIRGPKGERLHTQQSPVALLLRIILSSTVRGDVVLDPLAGTGTTIAVADQLGRKGVAIEIDPEYVRIIKARLKSIRVSDSILRYRGYYRFTPHLDAIWPV